MIALPDIALSVRQPKAYLAGCLKGDACIVRSSHHKHGYLQLKVADWDFAYAFSDAVLKAYGVDYIPRPDERGYALVRTYNGHGRFDELRYLEPDGAQAQAAWLRGLFDSEGNVVCVRKPRGPHSWDRRVAFFSTNAATLARAGGYLSHLFITSRVVNWPHSRGHKGSLPVGALIVTPGMDNYSRFATAVGSSIERKAARLAQLPTTYHPDMPARLREMQLMGAAKRAARRDAGGVY